MKTNVSKCVAPVAVLLFCVGLVFGIPSHAKDPKKLAILPFTMNADRDLSFLQEGITDMLTSRLAWKGELEVLEKGLVKEAVSRAKGPLSKESALAIGKDLRVDYVILGSLTVFGDSVSIDSKIFDVARGEELVSAFNQAKGMDSVIPTVTQFAQDINEKIMGRVVASPAQTARPEGPKGPGGLMAEGQAFEGKGVSHTQAVRAEVVSLDVGDVDGDGKTELVLVSADTVYVYKWGEKGLVQFKTFKERFANNFLWVSVGDMDGNGRAEIYVSNVGAADVSSLVIEWDGRELRRIADKLPWFLRVMEMPGKGKVLLGQRRASGGGFLGGVEILKREGNRYVATDSVSLPPQANVYNFALVDFDNKGKVDIVLLTSSDYLELLVDGNESIWKSEEPYGGTYSFLEEDSFDLEKNRIFMPSPILVTDIDEDGRKEVMVCKNASSVRRLLGKFQTFSGGTLDFLGRDEAGLTRKWSTKRFGGAMVGYQVADLDYDGQPELVIVSAIREERMIAGNPRSRIVVYDLK
jgi:TolB-like protein